MELSNYQKEIIEYFDANPSENIIVKALAGTGKSTLLKLLTDRTTTSDIYVAFNNSIAEEFRGKITNPKTKVSTLHSLALSIMNHNLSKSDGKAKVGIGSRSSISAASNGAKLDNFKIHKIIDDLIMAANGRNIEFEKRIFYKDNYVSLYNLCRLTRTDMADENSIKKIINDYCLFMDYSGNDFPAPLTSTILIWLENIDKRSKKEFNDFKTIDFTDMLYLTYLKLKKEEWEVPYWAYYTNIFVDEAQDLSNLQINFLKFIKRKGGRYVFVGDFHQCQPYGTKISLSNGEIKNIEDIEIGDKVVEFTNVGDKERKFVGYGDNKYVKNDYKVIDKQEFFTTQLVKITNEDNQSSSYTTNHICFAKFNREKTQNAICLYLMHRNDGLFRIGKVHMYSSQTTLGIKLRTRNEGFDRCWILDIYDNDREAWVNEQKYSLKYQIPQIIFQDEKVEYSSEQREEIYAPLLEGMRGRAIALLDEFGRDINFPLYERYDIFTHLARDHSFKIHACNIIPKYMDCLTYHPEIRPIRGGNDKNAGEKRAPKPIYKNITKVERINGFSKVVGITTSDYHTYVADGIVTHNSIYSFAGANANSFGLIPKLFAPLKEFDLPINYRCPTSHLDKVNEHFGIPILPRPNAPVGSIYTIDKKEIVKYVKAGDMIISRKNKWLTEVILDLAKNGIPVYMQDKESVENIKNTITRQKAESLYQLKNKLGKVIEKYNKTLSKIRSDEENSPVSDTDKMIEVTSTNSKIDNISFILEVLKHYSSNPKNKYSTPKEFQVYVDKLLNTISTKDCVRICSVHKAKGLEAPNVFVLNEAKTCKDPRNSWEQNEQEKNLSYISITRAMDKLYLVKEHGA